MGLSLGMLCNPIRLQTCVVWVPCWFLLLWLSNINLESGVLVPPALLSLLRTAFAIRTLSTPMWTSGFLFLPSVKNECPWEFDGNYIESVDRF